MKRFVTEYANYRIKHFNTVALCNPHEDVKDACENAKIDICGTVSSCFAGRITDDEAMREIANISLDDYR